MKRNMKFLSLAMACTVAVGAMGIPSMVNRWTFADESLTSTTLAELTVNARDTQIIEVGQSVTFDSSSFRLWSPSGEVLHDYNDASTIAYTFVTPGLYAYQYKNSEGVYSKQEYIVVNSVIDNEIVLTQQISAFAKTGTTVTIPACSTDGVVVTVYSPYGETVSVSNGKFSNIANIKGTYYIEYSKNGIYKYITVEFGDSYSENEIKDIDSNENALYHFEYNSDLKEIEKNGVIYMFKHYKLGATVYDKYGRKVEGQNVNVSVNFNESESEELYLGSFDSEAFAEAEITDLDEAGAKKFTIKIKDTKTGLEKTIEAPFKFNNKCVYVETDSVVKDFITVEDLKAETGFKISGAMVKLADGYSDDDNCLAGNIAKLKLSYPNDTGKVVGEDDNITVTENKVEEIVSSASISSSKTDLTYDNIDTKRRIINAEYSYTIDLGTVGNHTWTTTSVVKIVKDETAFADNQKPIFGEFNDYECIIKKSVQTRFTVPYVKVTDLTNTGDSSNGVTLRVYYSQDGTEQAETQIGASVILETGDYTFTYVATDSCGNVTTKSLSVKVYEDSSNSDVIPDSLTAGVVSVIKSSEGYEFRLNGSNATNCMIYEDGKTAVVPKSVSYENGKITKIVVEETKNNFVIVLNALNNQNKECYIGIGIDGKVNVSNIKPYSYNYRQESSSYELRYNNRLEVTAGDKILWTAGNDYTIESTAMYIINNGYITTQTSGTIQITNNNTKQSAVVVVSTGEVSAPEFYSSSKKVVSVKNTDGTITNKSVTVSIPYIRNYFGYTLLSSVVSTSGGAIEFENNTLTIDRVDNFTVRHTFNYADTTEVLTETISSGNTQKPVITIENPYESTIVSGDVTRINLVKATAVDKFGNIIKLGKENIVVKNSSGKIIEVKNDGEQLYVEVESAGIYTVSYSVTDSDGLTAVDTVNFVVTFPEETEKGISIWAIIGIVLGSLLVCAGVGYVIYVCIKKNKMQQKFINKNRQAKKTENAGIVLYTIAESKDGSYWTVKKSSRVVAKEKTREEAMQKVTDEKCKIKVYSKNGRLIDSIDR